MFKFYEREGSLWTNEHHGDVTLPVCSGTRTGDRQVLADVGTSEKRGRHKKNSRVEQSEEVRDSENDMSTKERSPSAAGEGPLISEEDAQRPHIDGVKPGPKKTTSRELTQQTSRAGASGLHSAEEHEVEDVLVGSGGKDPAGHASLEVQRKRCRSPSSDVGRDPRRSSTDSARRPAKESKRGAGGERGWEDGEMSPPQNAYPTPSQVSGSPSTHPPAVFGSGEERLNEIIDAHTIKLYLDAHPDTARAITRWARENSLAAAEKAVLDEKQAQTRLLQEIEELQIKIAADESAKKEKGLAEVKEKLERGLEKVRLCRQRMGDMDE
ncbi:hypothetical protein IAT38_006965 [Cryptococcus sp. DSM 104549]